MSTWRATTINLENDDEREGPPLCLVHDQSISAAFVTGHRSPHHYHSGSVPECSMFRGCFGSFTMQTSE